MAITIIQHIETHSKPAQRNNAKPKQPPLIFIHRDSYNRHRSKNEAKLVASHASGCYRRWEKNARRKIVLDSSTKSILSQPVPSLATKRACLAPPLPVNDIDNTEDVEYQNTLSRLDTYHQDMLKSTYAPEDPLSRVFAFQHVKDNAWTSLHSAATLNPMLYTPPTSPFSSQFFDPFSTSFAMLDPEVQATLHFYFKVIRPFIRHLIPDWQWFDSLSEVQSKPVLAYAIAALSSTFLSGCLKGGPGVVLPPLPSEADVSKDDSRLLWPVPPWLRLQAMCIRELNKELKRQGDAVEESVFQAVLFLFRLAVILADGASARMHLNALEHIEGLRCEPRVDMGRELAVLRVNIIAAFLHSSTIVVVRTKRKGQTESLTVEVDQKGWPEKEYWSHQAGLNGRLLAWAAGANEAGRRPSDWIQADSDAAIERMDPGSRNLLSEEEWIEVKTCYQISLYFAHYLNGVSFSTSCAGVTGQLLELKKKLSSADLQKWKFAAPTALFYSFIAGSMASRGKWERSWFIDKLADNFMEVQWMDDVLDRIEQCIDPGGICWTVLEEIWEEVLDARLAKLGGRRIMEAMDEKVSLYRTGHRRPFRRNRPMSRQPDLKAERVVIEREIDTFD